MNIKPIYKISDFLSPCHQVLMYHRVGPVMDNYFMLNVKPELFEKHIKSIQKTIISLNQAVLGLKYVLFKRRSFSVTFDDGYADNYYYAFPLLKKYNVPATIFVTTDYINTKTIPWPEHFKALLTAAGTEKELQNVFINIDNRFSDSGPGELHLAFRRMKDQNIRNELMAKAAQKLSITLPRDKDCEMLTDWMIKEMADSGLVNIGAHTCSHPFLPLLPRDEQRKEIAESKERLEQLTGRKINLFAYPYGSPDSYTRETKAIVKELGFAAAFVVKPGCIKPGHDPFTLKRKMALVDTQVDKLI